MKQCLHEITHRISIPIVKSPIAFRFRLEKDASTASWFRFGDKERVRLVAIFQLNSTEHLRFASPEFRTCCHMFHGLTTANKHFQLFQAKSNNDFSFLHTDLHWSVFRFSPRIADTLKHTIQGCLRRYTRRRISVNVADLPLASARLAPPLCCSSTVVLLLRLSLFRIWLLIFRTVRVWRTPGVPADGFQQLDHLCVRKLNCTITSNALTQSTISSKCRNLINFSVEIWQRPLYKSDKHHRTKLTSKFSSLTKFTAVSQVFQRLVFNNYITSAFENSTKMLVPIKNVSINWQLFTIDYPLQTSNHLFGFWRSPATVRCPSSTSLFFSNCGNDWS